MIIPGVSRSREVLTGRNPRGPSCPSAKASLIGAAIGLLFMCVGVEELLASREGMGKLAEVGRSKGLRAAVSQLTANTALPFMLGPVFSICGSAFAIAGLAGARRAAGIGRQRRRYQHEPWKWEYPWDPRGIRDDNWRVIRYTFFFVVAWFVFLTPFSLFTWFIWRETLPVIITVIFDLLGIAILAYGLYLLVRQMKYGSSFLAFGAFPFAPGRHAAMRFSNPRGFRRFRKITVTLRFVEEVVQGKGEERSAVCCQAYADTQIFGGDGEQGWDGRGIDVAFDLPADAPSTQLSSLQPRYWELEVHADTPGVDFRTIFLVPVYKPAQ